MGKTINFEMNENKYEVFIPSYSDFGTDIENAVEYFTLLGTFCMTPTDAIVAIEDAGVDFETVTNFDLFMMMLKSGMSDKLFRFTVKVNGIAFDGFEPHEDTTTKELVLFNPETGVAIYENAFDKIFNILVDEFGFDLKPVKFKSDDAKKYYIAKQRRYIEKQRRETKKEKSFMNIIDEYMFSLNKQKKFIDDISKMPISEVCNTESFREFLRDYYNGEDEI